MGHGARPNRIRQAWITRPLRHNGQAYFGINILILRASATAEGFTAPILDDLWQAQELKGQVCRGEKGSLVVYANAITRTETGEEVEKEITFLKVYTVFNIEQDQQFVRTLIRQAAVALCQGKRGRARCPGRAIFAALLFEP